MSAVLVAAAAVVVGQFVQGILGFGSALVAVPVLVWVFGPVEAIVLQALLDAVGTLSLVVRPRGPTRWLLVGAVAAPMWVGQFVGTELLVGLPEGVVRAACGVVVAALGLGILVRGEAREDATSNPVSPRELFAGGAVAGFLGGLMAGVVGPSGPPIVVWARRCLPRDAFRAQLIGVFFVGSIGLVAVCAARGLVTTPRLGTAALLVGPGLGGAWAGARVSPLLPVAAFARFVGAVLTLSGLALAVG